MFTRAAPAALVAQTDIQAAALIETTPPAGPFFEEQQTVPADISFNTNRVWQRTQLKGPNRFFGENKFFFSREGEFEKFQNLKL